MNLIDNAKRRQAASLVHEGISVSCSRPITYEASIETPVQPQHFMMASGETPAKPESYGRSGVSEYFGFAPHGLSITHLDAPAHTLWRSTPDAPRTMFNGVSDSCVTHEGASAGSIELVADGIVTRGLLLDMPAVFGVEYLEPSTALCPGDLEAAEKRQGITAGPGDALLVRTGHSIQRQRRGVKDAAAGLQAACLPWLRERDIAVLACEPVQDVHPPEYPRIGLPIHGVGMAALGLWLLDNIDPEPLLACCHRLGRWEFMITIAPIRFTTATGSPTNPMAMF